jgi:hypothetical protein
MTKNITVIDEQGREYGATWPKRANGLVKKGRARFVDENTICLACPPDKYLEDIEMENNINEKFIPAQEKEIPSLKKEDVTVEYILSQIEAIRKDTEYLHMAIDKLAQSQDITLPEALPHNMGATLGIVTKAEGLRDMVRCRETTNQKLIAFYEKVYNDIKPLSSGYAKDLIVEMIRATNAGTEAPDYIGIINALNHMTKAK